MAADGLAEAVVEAVVVVEEGTVAVAVATQAPILHPWVAVVAGKPHSLSFPTAKIADTARSAKRG